MEASKTAFDLIKLFEGFEPKAYLCPAKVWTIGYGKTEGVREGDTITLDQANADLIAEVNLKFAPDVSKVLKVPVTQGMFDALVSFAYNLGIGNLSNSTLLRKINDSDYVGASLEFDRWVYAGNKVLPGLVRRRTAEKELFVKSINEKLKEIL
jgi:lysozyme